MSNGLSQDAAVSGLARIATAFERSRFDTLVLRWQGGGLSLRKAAPSDAPVPPAATYVVVSPKIGIFHIADTGVAVGLDVAPQSALGFIDVLGDRHPVTAPKAGTIAECCVADGAFVEYGAPLFRLFEA